MAKVTVQMPASLETVDRDLVAATAVALTVAAEETVSRVRVDPEMPVDQGGARRSIAATRVRLVNGNLRIGIVTAGEAAMRTGVLEKGRRAGARGPSWRHLAFPPGARGAKSTDLAAMRGGWIFRKARQEIEAKAQELQAEYLAAHPAKRKGVKRPSINYFRARAVFLIASAKASAIHALGIRDRGFVRRNAPFFFDRVRARLREQLIARGVITRSGQ